MRKASYFGIFILIEVLLFSFYFSHVHPKKVTAEFQIESTQVSYLDVYYNLGKGWNPNNRLRIELNSDKKDQRIEIETPTFPKQIRIDFGDDHDTVQLSNFSIYNSVDNTFPVKENYSGSNDISIINFNSSTEIELITQPNDPYILFKTNSDIPYSKRFELAPFIFKLLFVAIGTLLTLFFYKLNLLKIHRGNTYVIIFLTVLCIAPSDSIFQYLPHSKNEENRQLAEKPKFDNTRQFKNDLEEYLKDHFKLKQLFTYLDAWVTLTFFKTSSQSQNVVLGKHQHMFPGTSPVMDDYRRLTSFSNQELQTIYTNLIERKVWLAKQNIPFLLVIAPMKQTVYEEYMGNGFVKGIGESRTTQLTNFLKSKSDLEVLDLRPALLKAKVDSESDLFYKYDMHWNQLGAYFGYQEIMKWVNTIDSTIRISNLTDFKIDTSFLANGDMAKSLLLHNKLQKRELRFSLIDSTSKRKYDYYQGLINGEKWIVEGGEKRLLMFRDSYGVQLIPFLSNHFEKSVFIWDQIFDSGLILREKPDFVIQEVAEIHLSHLLFENGKELKES